MSTPEPKENIQHTIGFKEPKTEIVGDAVNVQYADDEFIANSPVPTAVLKQVEQYQDDYLEHLTDKTTDIAIDNFRKNSETNKVMATAPYGTNGSVTTEVIKEYNITDHEGVETNDPTVLVVIEQPNNIRDRLVSLKERLKEELD